jgi:hypothetical protein
MYACPVDVNKITCMTRLIKLFSNMTCVILIICRARERSQNMSLAHCYLKNE